MTVWKIFVYSLEGEKELDIVADEESVEITREAGEKVKAYVEENVDLERIDIESGAAKKLGEIEMEDSKIIDGL